MLRLLLYLTTAVHFSTCGAMDLCQGDNQCVLCTVTGPTVIDIHGHLNSVQDRCAYDLMETKSIPDLKVHATFKERRRTDVSFLDSVILQLDGPGVNINLEQGGRVLVDNVKMTLNATAQLVHGVELSKDQDGVTAKMSHLKYLMTVFFDGSTAQIHIKGPRGQVPPVEGLCGNSNRSFSEEKASDYSPTDCEVQHEDPSNSTIRCQIMTGRCNLLKEAPFTACHSHVDPQPYTTACSNTLCKYPAVDGLDCQFLEAYVRACSLYSSNTPTGWRTKAICSESLCQDRFCSAHEFCGQDIHTSETRCHCRAVFASTYRSQNTLGEAVCNETSRSINLVGCLLGDKGIQYSDLHLYDKTCRAEIDNVTHMVTIGFDSKTNPCGTMVRLDENGNIVNKNGIIVETTKQELMDFTCPFVIPEIKIDFSVGIKVNSANSSTVIQYVTSGVWNYTLTMKAYTDAGRTQLVDSNTELHLDQKVWFALETDGLDSEIISLVTQSCYATSEPSPDASLRYDLIIDGCANAADKTVQVERNGDGTSSYFSFNMFEFYGQNGQVYLHCKLNLCVKEGNTCAPSCNPTSRTRRSTRYKYADEKPAILIMAWNT
ncbi:uromodulin-like [Thunnus albacares]|uniref:uromodulin-like n=1 Tax=Thunnus albacares TaxID=8236 RepID=UPI001CF65EA2|nr:uromodulin-like [Thunnus albacares]